MFNVVEMPTARVIATVDTHEEALTYIESINSSPEYTNLLSTYGSERRVQQELTIEPV
jgi:hypothetical protein